jgi:hypothetical protein
MGAYAFETTAVIEGDESAAVAEAAHKPKARSGPDQAA